MNKEITSVVCGAGGFVGSNLRQQLPDSLVLPVERLVDVNWMHNFLKENEPYHLYYLAAYGNLHGQNDIPAIYQAIVTKFLNVLLASRQTDCRAIVTAGTTSEYGNKTGPMKEDQLLVPRTFYGAAKAATTHLAQAWAIQEKTPVVVFRPASITGVGEQDIHLIPTLIRSCMLNEPMPFVGGYNHDYIDVSDVCSALVLLADNAMEHKGEIFNVGSGVQHTNLQVREMIEQITKRRAHITTDSKLDPQNISDVWIADSSKMRFLGWKPKKDLMTSLKEMVKAI